MQDDRPGKQPPRARERDDAGAARSSIPDATGAPRALSHDEAEALRREILGFGFDRAGFTALNLASDHARFEAWLDAGHAGGMGYLARSREIRADPAGLLPGAKSAIVVALSYHVRDPGSLASAKAGHGWVSRYAWGRDYHKVLKGRLRRAAQHLRDRYGAGAVRACVDSAPLLERSLAARAGLGWIAKNTMLIDRELGSYTFLGVLLCDLALPEPTAKVPDHCGSCTACLDACPTQAFPAPGVLDARRCISYLSIEHRGEIPAPLATLMGDHVFGCDICQEVCPWNRKAPETAVADFHPRPTLRQPDLASLIDLDRVGLLARFAGTALMRAGLEGLRRNARIALANQERRA